jgi:HlyD family secretion protein
MFIHKEGSVKKKIGIALLLAVLAGAALVLRTWQARQHGNVSTLRVSGNVEVTDAEISFKIPGRVVQRLVDEGQPVREGQPIALLDRVELSQQVALQRAELNAAEADLAELLAGNRPEEIEQGRAALSVANSEVERAAADHRRARELYQHGIVSVRDFEIRQADYDVAQAKLRDATERLRLLEKGPRQEKIAQARARVEAARQALAKTLTQLGYTTVPSPLTGVVISKNVEPGEYVAAGTPIVTVGDLEHIWLRSYVNETDLGRVKLGQTVHVTTDTYPGRVYQGRVSFISPEAEFTPKNVQTDKERVKLVYRVKIDISNPRTELKPGMPADAEILLAEASCPAPAQAAQATTAKR